MFPGYRAIRLFIDQNGNLQKIPLHMPWFYRVIIMLFSDHPVCSSVLGVATYILAQGMSRGQRSEGKEICCKKLFTVLGPTIKDTC